MKRIHNTFRVPYEKSEMVYFTSSVNKNIAIFAYPWFPVKLISCITFGSASSACCLLKSIDIML